MKTKKLMTAILCACMLGSLFPAGVFADDGTNAGAAETVTEMTKEDVPLQEAEEESAADELPETKTAPAEDSGSENEEETSATEETAAETVTVTTEETDSESAPEAAEQNEPEVAAEASGAAEAEVSAETEETAEPGEAAEAASETEETAEPCEAPKADEKAEPEKVPETAPKAGEETPEEKDTKSDKETEKGTKYPAFLQSNTVSGVQITVSAEEGVFPEGAALSVKEVPVYKEARAEEAIEELRDDNVNVAVSYTFDIKILDAEGNEIQPAEGKNVNVSFRTAEVADRNLDTQVYHIDDHGNAEELEVDTAGRTAIVETDGFSLYTVEFTYNNMEYVLPGGSEVALSKILDKVGLVGTVTKVECSNTDLFYATDASGEWKVVSCRPFSTTEWMKVTIGKLEYEIAVTDAQEVIVGDLKYSIDNGVAIVTGPVYHGLTAETVTIEKEITYEDNKYSVTAIKYGAFFECDSLESITIPDSVESIGMYAFKECSSLKSITIPDSVESIGDWAFASCESLSSITIPKSVKNIGDQAFSNVSFDGSPEVFYGGTLEDWEKIAIGDYWISTAGSPVTFQCTYIAAVRPEGAGTAEGTMTIKNFIRPSEQRLTILDLTAKANKGYHFDYWSVDDSTVSCDKTYTNYYEDLARVKSLTAVFERDTGNLTITKTVTGGVTEEDAKGALAFTIRNEDTGKYLTIAEDRTPGWTGTKTEVSLGSLGKLEGYNVTGDKENGFRFTVGLKDVVIGKYTVTETKSYIRGLKLKNTSVTSGSDDLTKGGTIEIDLTDNYEPAQKVEFTVTFTVKNGAWNDTTTKDKVLTLSRYENEDLALKFEDKDVPKVGSEPDKYCKAGRWDKKPETDTAISENKTYIYSYEKENYTVSIVKDPAFKEAITGVEIGKEGGDPEASGQVTAHGGDKLYIKTTVKDGYHFTNYTASGTAPAWEGNDPSKAEQTIEVQGTAEIMAHAEANNYTVHFDPNAESGVTGEMQDQDMVYGESQNLSENRYQRIGWTFKNWNTKKDGTGDPYTDKQNVMNLTTENGETTPLYAQWTANKDTKYTVEYYYQKEGAYPPAATETTERSGETDTKAAATEADKTPSKEGYVFDEKAPNVLSGTIEGNGSLVLKVFFKQQFTVTFETDGGTKVPSVTVKYGETIEEPAAPKKTGFTFGGWYSEKTFKTAFDFSTPITGNTTIHAKWTKNKEITYTVVSGADSTWTKGDTKDITITVKRSEEDGTCFSHFAGVAIAGKKLTKGTDYKAESGSTVITLKSAYLQKLAADKYKVTISFDDGSTETYLTIKKAETGKKSGSTGGKKTSGGGRSASTGDESNAGLWAMLMLLSALFLVTAGTVSVRKTRRRK